MSSPTGASSNAIMPPGGLQLSQRTEPPASSRSDAAMENDETSETAAEDTQDDRASVSQYGPAATTGEEEEQDAYTHDQAHFYDDQQQEAEYDFSRSPDPSDHILPPPVDGFADSSASPVASGVSLEVFTRSSRHLYASYFFAAWGDRMWEFAAILFLIDLFPVTLLYSSVFGLVEKLAAIAAGPEVGRYIDRQDRLATVRWTIVGQNASVCFASLLFWAALSSVTLDADGANTQPADARSIVSYLFILAMGAIAAVASMANKVAIHKDWVVVVCAGDDARLTQLNSNMRRIDLSCSVLAPLLVGLLSIVSSATAVAFVAAWSAVSLGVEYRLIGWVFDSIPALQGKADERMRAEEAARQQQHQHQQARHPQPEEIAADEHRLPPPRIDIEDPSLTPLTIEDAALPSVHLRVLYRAKRFLVTFRSEMRAYRAHPVFLASLAYAILYCSVLSLGGIMAAWLKIRGVSNTLIAIVRGLAALVGIGSTFLVPAMIHRWGLLRAGLVALWAQAAMLLPVAFSFVYYFRDGSARHKWD